VRLRLGSAIRGGGSVDYCFCTAAARLRTACSFEELTPEEMRRLRH